MDQLEDLLQRAGTLTLGRLADVNRQDSGAVHDLVESVAEQLLKDTDPKVLELLASHNAPLRNSPTLSPNDPQLTDLHALPFVMRRGDDTDMEEVVCNRGVRLWFLRPNSITAVSITAVFAFHCDFSLQISRVVASVPA
mmetsp:Transcript_113910/g.261503  ORF Transcript_113910/g.261503 Transcript_113910/m.261503 type:complete len:139 (+) Transcript_113910:27-443(+)